MRRTRKLLFLLTLAASAAACSDELPEGSGGAAAKEGYVRLDMTATIPGFRVVTTRAAAAADEALTAMQNHFYAFCFDQQGGLLEVADVTGATAKNGKYGATAEVPALTRIIHFVAGPDLSVAIGTAERGVSETTLIPALTSSFTSQTEQEAQYPQEIVRSFWCRKTFDDENALKAQSLEIKLLRNYAEASCSVENGKADAMMGWTVADFTVLNRRAYGTVAPFNPAAESSSSPFDYSPMQDNERFVTEVGDEQHRETLLSNPSSDKNRLDGVGLYDNPNSLENPVFAVVKLKHSNNSVRYYKVAFIDSNSDQLPITRNCKYRVLFRALPPNDPAYCYNSFSAAAAPDATAINNPWVSVEPETPAIGDQTSSITITDGIHQGFSKAGEVQLEVVCAGAESVPVRAEIVSNDEVISGALSVEPASGTTQNEQGTYLVKFTLNTPPEPVSGKRYAEAQILVKGGKFGRIVHIYLMKPFTFEKVSFADKSIGSDNIAGGKAKPTESMAANMVRQLKYSIPKDYPEKLLPVKVKITSNFWNAYRVKCVDWPYTDLPIIYEDTKFTVKRNGTEEQITLPYNFKYSYPMDKYDDTPGGYNPDDPYMYDYVVDMKCLSPVTESDIENCPIDTKSEYNEKTHVHFFLEAEHFETQEIIARFLKIEGEK